MSAVRKTPEEIGREAAEHARSELFKHCRAVKLTPRRALKRIAEGLDAMENKVFYDKDRGKCIIGPDMINWAARQKAIDQTICVLDMKPPDKAKLDVNMKGDLTVNIIDRFGAGDQPKAGKKTQHKAT